MTWRRGDISVLSGDVICEFATLWLVLLSLLKTQPAVARVHRDDDLPLYCGNDHATAGPEDQMNDDDTFALAFSLVLYINAV